MLQSIITCFTVIISIRHILSSWFLHFLVLIKDERNIIAYGGIIDKTNATQAVHPHPLFFYHLTSCLWLNSCTICFSLGHFSTSRTDPGHFSPLRIDAVSNLNLNFDKKSRHQQWGHFETSLMFNHHNALNWITKKAYLTRLNDNCSHTTKRLNSTCDCKWSIFDTGVNYRPIISSYWSFIPSYH